MNDNECVAGQWAATVYPRDPFGHLIEKPIVSLGVLVVNGEKFTNLRVNL